MAAAHAHRRTPSAAGPLLAALLHTMGAALLVWWLVRLLVVPVAVPQMATAPQGSRPVTQGLHRTA